jgi:hypothetical protein
MSSLLVSHPSHARRGAALIITLVVLVLMSIMVISLTDIMRTERGASHSHLEKARADMLAQIGTSKVIATLRKETADPNRNWISQPGQLVASDPATSTAKTVKEPAIPLSSGAPVNVGAGFTPAALRPAQLNVPTFEQGAGGTIPPHLITNLPDPANSTKAVPMPVRWIYVRQDGSEDSAEQPVLTNKANPIVGRYAYWTDDESSKVNYNLAWTRGADNPNPVSHPTKINLPTLFGSADPDAEKKAAAIHFYSPLAVQPPTIPKTTAAYRAFPRFFFQTPEDARQVERLQAGVDASLLATKFNVTHYNHDPDTTFFNEPRIILTTKPERAGWSYNGTDWVGTNGKPWPLGRPIFLNIAAKDTGTGQLHADLWEPFVNPDPAAMVYRIDPNKLADTIELLNAYLKRTDWPMASGSSLQAKYYAGKPERLTQLSLNIINYVRTKESAGEPITKLVVPVRGEQAPGGRFVMMEIATSANAYIGVTRTPKITEMGVWVKSTPSSTASDGKSATYQCKYKAEIHLPKNFGLASVDLTKLSIYTNGAESNIAATDVVIPNHTGAILAAGEYATVTKTASITVSPAARPSKTTLRFAIALASNINPGSRRRLDVTPLGTAADYNVDPVGVAESDIGSLEVDDPRVNSHRADWKQRSGNSFGTPNSISTIGMPQANVLPQQDTDAMGNITDISLYMPPPKGALGNETGFVLSAGELGYIHTGMESGAGAGVPWRTLRLQPNNYPGTTNAEGVRVPTAPIYPPDWAFMDLFTVPVDVPPDIPGKPRPRTVFAPRGTAIGGRVNMNAKPEPFHLDRVDPLAAVFEGATFDAADLSKKISNARARNIATAVYNRTLGKNVANVPDGKQYGYQNGYDSPGEVVEIAGVADEGEASEQLVREVANLITSRGNVFSVYTIGQALKQTPAGGLVVTGEQRQQSMIERYSDATNVRFRSIYFRDLTP